MAGLIVLFPRYLFKATHAADRAHVAGLSSTLFVVIAGSYTRNGGPLCAVVGNGQQCLFVVSQIVSSFVPMVVVCGCEQ